MKDKNHCTIFDVLTKEKGTDKLIKLLTDNCLSSLITNPLSHRTFILPPATALSKVKKADLDNTIKRHVLSHGIDPEKYFKKGDEASVPTMIKGVRMDIVKKGKKEIVVEGIKCKLIATASNGVIYSADKLLPEKAPMERSSSRKKRSSSRRKQRGGFNLSGNNIMNIGAEIMTNFASTYEKQYPLSLEDNWSARLLANLIVYLKNNQASFNKGLLPWLGNDPLSTLENLLQVYDSSDAMRILSPDTLMGFMQSPIYMNPSLDVLNEGRSILRSVCNQAGVPGLCTFDSEYQFSSFVENKRDYIRELLLADPVQARQNIVSVYEQLAGEPDMFDPGMIAIFDKVWARPDIGKQLLRNDLISFTSQTITNLPWQQHYSAMSTLWSQPIDVVLQRVLGSAQMGSRMQTEQLLFDDTFIGDFVNSDCFFNCATINVNNPDTSSYIPFINGGLPMSQPLYQSQQTDLSVAQNLFGSNVNYSYQLDSSGHPNTMGWGSSLNAGDL